ncbi:MAG: exopolysaccharide biosynthesis polyprenyl glycosylphosphotransferase [Lachnospiraceae bacterium]
MKRLLQRFRNTIFFILKLILYGTLMVLFFEIMGIDHPYILRLSRTSVVTVFSFVLSAMMLTSIYGHCDIGERKSKPIIYSIALAMLFTDGITYLMLMIMNVNDRNNAHFQIESVHLFLIIYVLQVVVTILITYLGNYLYFVIMPPEKCVVVTGSPKRVQSFLNGIRRFKKQYCITYTVDEKDESMWDKVLECDTIFLHDVSAKNQRELMEYAYRADKHVCVNPGITDVMGLNAKHAILDDVPIIVSGPKYMTLEQRFAKRAIDIAVSLTGLIILSPVLLGCAIAIKMDDGGKILFKQDRVTRGRQIFSIYKFRTMKENVENRSASSGDDRITKVGKGMRKYRLDEIPQLVNILKGEMSLVGPRPEMIENETAYQQDLPEFAYRHRVKAGLTGYAQISGKYNTSSKDKLMLDLQYIQSFSLWNDLKLIFQTPIVLLKASDSTEGFQSNEPIEKE